MKRFGLAVVAALAIWLALQAIGTERVATKLNSFADTLEDSSESLPRFDVASADSKVQVVRRERDHSAYCARREQSPPAPTAPFSPQSFRVYDADTIFVGDEGVRISNLDAPEIRQNARCPEEDRLGQTATAETERFLRSARRVEILPDGTRDRHCRIRATVTADGIDLGSHIVERNLGAPWTGQSRNWCAD